MSTEYHNMMSKVNTILLTIVIGLLGWNVKKTQDMGEKQAAMVEQIRNLERIAYKSRSAD